MDPRLREIELREDEVEKLVSNILGIPWGGTSTNASPFIGGDMSILVRLHKKNIQFINSEYYFKEKSIIHFTNLQSAFSILGTNKIRLYNLYKKNDEKEFIYASEILKEFCKPTESYFYDYEEEINAVRFNTFILSATIKDNIKDFWGKDYSSNGNGVGFEFSFFHNPDKWEGFYLSPVKYGYPDKIFKLHDDLLKLQDKHKNIDYKINLNQLIPFYKEQKWSDENEIRLMTFYPQEYKLETYHDENDENIKCINLPLLSNEFNKDTFTVTTIPFLKIEKIYIGSQVEKSVIDKIKKTIEKNYFNEIQIIPTLPIEVHI